MFRAARSFESWRAYFSTSGSEGVFTLEAARTIISQTFSLLLTCLKQPDDKQDTSVCAEQVHINIESRAMETETVSTLIPVKSTYFETPDHHTLASFLYKFKKYNGTIIGPTGSIQAFIFRVYHGPDYGDSLMRVWPNVPASSIASEEERELVQQKLNQARSLISEDDAAHLRKKFGFNVEDAFRVDYQGLSRSVTTGK